MPERAVTPPEASAAGARSPMVVARHGLPFGNRYAWESRARRIGPIHCGARRIRYGLCGGMCYAALDYFHAGLPVPALYYPPARGTPLHRYLVRRQIDSWRYLWVPLRSVVASVIAASRPVRASCRARAGPRRARSDVLVRVRRGDPTANHQVVVTGYEREYATGRVRLMLYDPNHHGLEVALSLNEAPDSLELDAIQSTGEPVRGFFLLPYRPRRRGLPVIAASIY